jgi:hypothetical protein
VLSVTVAAGRYQTLAFLLDDFRFESFRLISAA